MSTKPYIPGEIFVLIFALVSLPYYLCFHPVKTYKLLMHNVGWYE